MFKSDPTPARSRPLLASAPAVLKSRPFSIANVPMLLVSALIALSTDPLPERRILALLVVTVALTPSVDPAYAAHVPPVSVPVEELKLLNPPLTELMVP